MTVKDLMTSQRPCLASSGTVVSYQLAYTELQGKRTLGHGALTVPVVTMPRARPRLLSKYWQVMVSVAV